MNKHSPMTVDFSAIPLLGQHVIPLRSSADNLRRLHRAAQKLARRWESSRVDPRDFRVIAAPAAGAVVIVRIE